VPVALLLALLPALLTAACGDDDEAADAPTSAAAAVPTTMHVEFDSGSIAPPYNHEAVLDLRLEGAHVEGSYRLTYRYRDALDTVEEGADEDVAWSGALAGEVADRARSLAARPALGGKEPEGVGGSSWRIVVNAGDGRHVTGAPEDETAWQALLCAVDAQARQAAGRTGTAQSC
jgi:hypothetical protein